MHRRFFLRSLIGALAATQATAPRDPRIMTYRGQSSEDVGFVYAPYRPISKAATFGMRFGSKFDPNVNSVVQSQMADFRSSSKIFEIDLASAEIRLLAQT